LLNINGINSDHSLFADKNKHMKNSREEISKLIKQISKRQKDIQALTAHQLESVVAEIVAQNKKILDVQRAVSPFADIVVSIRDKFNTESKFAIEVKKAQRAIDTSAIEQLRKYVEDSNLTKGLLVTDSFFSASDLNMAKKWQTQIELIDQSGLRRWIEEYQNIQEQFAADIASQISKLDLHELFTITEEEVKKDEEIDPSSLVLPYEHQERIVRVNNLPLTLLRNILHDPRHLYSLTPRQFEEFIAEVVDQLGFTNVILTPFTRDGGRDVIASNEINDIPITFYFECKKYAGGNKVQLDALRALLGTVAHHATEANIGVLVTTSRFTKGCRDLIMSECRLDGKDYDGILGWVGELKTKIN